MGNSKSKQRKQQSKGGNVGYATTPPPSSQPNVYAPPQFTSQMAPMSDNEMQSHNGNVYLQQQVYQAQGSHISPVYAPNGLNQGDMVTPSVHDALEHQRNVQQYGHYGNGQPVYVTANNYYYQQPQPVYGGHQQPVYGHQQSVPPPSHPPPQQYYSQPSCPPHYGNDDYYRTKQPSAPPDYSCEYNNTKQPSAPPTNYYYDDRQTPPHGAYGGPQ